MRKKQMLSERKSGDAAKIYINIVVVMKMISLTF